MTLHTDLPQDRLQALARGETLPDHTTGPALFADISGFTPLTETLTLRLGPRIYLRLGAAAAWDLIEGRSYERSVAAARAGLDEAEFTAAWDKGKQMTLDGAIEYALRG